jgi:hypothetical protein
MHSRRRKIGLHSNPMYACMRVCVSACMRVCVYARMQVHACICAYVYMCVKMRARECARACVGVSYPINEALVLR